MLRVLFTAVLFICTSFSLSGQSEYFLSDQDLIIVLDSSIYLYQHSEYSAMAALLERYDDEHLSNDTLKLEFIYRKAMAYGHLSWSDKTFESIIDGLLLAQDINSPWMLQAFYRELGSFHDAFFNDQKTALRYLKQAAGYIEHMDSMSISGLTMDIGLTAVNAGELDTAKVYYEIAFDYLTQDSAMLEDVYAFYVPYLLATDQLDEAERLLNHLEKAWVEMNYINGSIQTHIEFSELYHLRGEYHRSLAHAVDAVAAAGLIEDVYFMADAIERRAIAEEILGMVDASAISYKLLVQLRDSIENMLKEQELSKKHQDFLMMEYQEELMKINQYNAILTEDVSVTKKWSAGALIGLLLIIAYFLWSLQHGKRKITALNAALELSNEQFNNLKQNYQVAITDLEKNKRELTSTALFVEKKNETLRSVKKMLSSIESTGNGPLSKTIRTARKMADSSINIDNNWDSFRFFFEQVYPSFIGRLKSKYPNLTQTDLRALSFLKMGLTNKESARLMGINADSFKKSKYRLKKKLKLKSEISIEQFLNSFTTA